MVCAVGPQLACSRRRAAAAAPTGLPCAETWMVSTLDVAEPGFGFCTVTCTVPTCWSVAVPVAVSCVELLKVVVRNCPPNTTTAPFTKFEPVAVSVKLPTLIVCGASAVKIGIGFRIVAAADAVARLSAALVAVTFTGFGFGRLAGAVYMPLASTVPRVEFPPVTLLTDHATAVLAVPVTVAENCCFALARICAVVGATFT